MGGYTVDVHCPIGSILSQRKRQQQKALSFQPTYHELTQGPAGSVWVPVYNPCRECVNQERNRIEAEGARVDSNAWQMPWRVRKQAVSRRVEWLMLQATLWIIALGISALIFCGVYALST